MNADGRTGISVLDTTTNAPVTLPALEHGEVSSVAFSRSEKKAALYVNGDRSPNNLYILDLASKKAAKVTESLNPAIDPQDLVDTEVVRFKARDGVIVPNILWKPHQANPSSKELTVKRRIPATKSRRRPSRSASRPPRRSAPPKKIE